MFSRVRCGRKCLVRTCWSTTSLWRFDLFIDTKIASVNMNMVSPTGDAAMFRTTITSFCSHTTKCSFHSLTGPRPIRSSRRMGMTPKVLYRSNTFWLCQSRERKRDVALSSVFVFVPHMLDCSDMYHTVCTVMLVYRCNKQASNTGMSHGRHVSWDVLLYHEIHGTDGTCHGRPMDFFPPSLVQGKLFY
jgi:hypothetical protein